MVLTNPKFSDAKVHLEVWSTTLRLWYCVGPVIIQHFKQWKVVFENKKKTKNPLYCCCVSNPRGHVNLWNKNVFFYTAESIWHRFHPICETEQSCTNVTLNVQSWTDYFWRLWLGCVAQCDGAECSDHSEPSTSEQSTRAEDSVKTLARQMTFRESVFSTGKIVITGL